MFTVVIPTRNAERFLTKEFINNLTGLRNTNRKLLFLDSDSDDRTLSIIKESGFKFERVSLHEFDHGGTRSLVRKYTDSEVVVFLTQDAFPVSKNDILELVKVFEDSSVGAAYGRQKPYENTNLFGKHLREFNYPEHSYVRSIEDKEKYGIKTAFLSNSFSAYRRSAMDDIGWFKDGLILGEDTYAGAKLLKKGYRLAYVSEAKVYHSHSYTVWEEFKRYFDIGVFHKMESWILEEFGKPEGEGMRYIKSEFNFLLDKKAYYKIPEFFVRNAMKFLGYKLGKHYTKLPRSIIKKISMHNRWWDKYWATEVKGL